MIKGSVLSAQGTDLTIRLENRRIITFPKVKGLRIFDEVLLSYDTEKGEYKHVIPKKTEAEYVLDQAVPPCDGDTLPPYAFSVWHDKDWWEFGPLFPPGW